MKAAAPARRMLGEHAVFPIGLGCMNLSHAYGVPPDAQAARALLETALDLGIDHFDTGCSPAQLALAWLLARAPHVIPIVGTTSMDHLRDNVAAPTLSIDPALIARVDASVDDTTISGPRYPAATLAEIDTEEPPPRLT